MHDVSGVPTLDTRQHDVGEQRREHTTLRSACLGAHQSALGQNARFQEGPHQSCHPPVGNAPTQARHDMVVIDIVEASLDVPFDNPLIGRTGPIGFGILPDRSDRVADMLQCIATGPLRSMSVSSSGADFVQASPTGRRSDEFDDPDLRRRVGFDARCVPRT